MEDWYIDSPSGSWLGLPFRKLPATLEIVQLRLDWCNPEVRSDYQLPVQKLKVLDLPGKILEEQVDALMSKSFGSL